jgi:hypothetical protein
MAMMPNIRYANKDIELILLFDFPIQTTFFFLKKKLILSMIFFLVLDVMNIFYFRLANTINKNRNQVSWSFFSYRSQSKRELHIMHGYSGKVVKV